MYDLSILALADSDIDRFMCAINRACGTCWALACALVSDRARLIGMPTKVAIKHPICRAYWFMHDVPFTHLHEPGSSCYEG